MSNQLETLLHTDSQISDYFILESLILSTRTSDLYKAFDKSRGVHISLWVGKGSLGINTNAGRKFLEDITKLQRIDPAISKILSFGIDSLGVPFCVFPVLDGYVITHGNIEKIEAERRYMACLRIMEKVHNLDISCGDLCSSSFWVQRSGEIILIGVMGINELDFVDKKITPSAESLFYISPEQVNEENKSASSDVYSLGVLGFRLFSGKYPQEFANQAVILSEIIPDPPVWGNQVFSTCLAVEKDQRYSKAGSVLAAISQIRENSALAESMPARLHKDSNSLVSKANTGLKLSKPISSAIIKTQPLEEKKENVSKTLLLKGVLVVFTVFIVSFAVFAALFKKSNAPVNDITDAYNIHEQVLQSDQLQEDNIAGPGLNANKQELFQKYIMSDDPISHDILIKYAKKAENEEDRLLAETAILDRARRLGLRRSAAIVFPWLRSLRVGQLPPAYDAILRSLDVTLPQEAIDSSLRQAYASYSRMILKLTAALTLDTGKFEQYQGVLSQLVGDASGTKDLGSRSSISIILFSTDLVSVFGDDAVQKREMISDDDVVWLLDVLAARNDIYIRVIASLAMERDLLSPIRKQFLTAIRDREDLPLDILNALVKAATGSINAEDVGRFGNWFDRAGEDLLLAICADSPDAEAKKAAFDILAAKSFSKEPASSLIKWVRLKAWDKRMNFAEAVGVLSNINYFSDDQINQAFDVFTPYIKDQAITSALLDSQNPKLVKAVVTKYSKNIGLGRRLVLLTYPDKDVRILAVKSLEGINDIAGLKMILDYYSKEKDPEVKKAYSDTFWVIREKEHR